MLPDLASFRADSPVKIFPLVEKLEGTWRDRVMALIGNGSLALVPLRDFRGGPIR